MHIFSLRKYFFFIKEMMFIKEAPLMNFILIRAKWPSSICRHPTTSIVETRIRIRHHDICLTENSPETKQSVDVLTANSTNGIFWYLVRMKTHKKQAYRLAS